MQYASIQMSREPRSGKAPHFVQRAALLEQVRCALDNREFLDAAKRRMGALVRLDDAVVVAAYEARIVGGEMATTAESLEVRTFTVEDLPWSDIAFETTIWALRDWVGSVRPGLDVASLGRIDEGA